MLTNGLKHKDELLRQVVEGTKRLGRLTHLRVTFIVSEREGVPFTHSFEFGYLEALDAIASDLYWDERGDWSEATIAKVERF